MKFQINSLTATRGFAAIMVYIFHFGRGVFPFDHLGRVFMDGNLAVSYFYVLSGFVLYISYIDKSTGYGTFMKKRFGRIGPAYILALLLFVPVYMYFYKMSYSTEFLSQFVLSLLFIQAYIPKYALVLNTAAWSISVELFFYLLFPLLLLLQKRKNNLFISLAIIVFVATQVSFYLLFKNDYTNTNNWNFFQYHPLIHINQFMVGMVGGFLYKSINLSRKKYLPMSLIGLCLVLVLIELRPAGIFYEVGLIAPFFMIFIIGTAVNDPRFLNIKPLIFFGEISYGIYILQFPVHELLAWFNSLYLKLSPPQFFYFSLAGLCAAAATSYYLLEKPFRNFVNKPSRKGTVAGT